LHLSSLLCLLFCFWHGCTLFCVVCI
jgi:hypothetical protein